MPQTIESQINDDLIILPAKKKGTPCFHDQAQYMAQASPPLFTDTDGGDHQANHQLHLSLQPRQIANSFGLMEASDLTLSIGREFGDVWRYGETTSQARISSIQESKTFTEGCGG